MKDSLGISFYSYLVHLTFFLSEDVIQKYINISHKEGASQISRSNE